MKNKNTVDRGPVSLLTLHVILRHAAWPGERAQTSELDIYTDA